MTSSNCQFYRPQKSSEYWKTLSDSQRLSTKQNKGICSMRATPLLALFLNQEKCLVFTTKSILHFLSPKTMYCFLRLQPWYYFGLAQMGFPSVWEEQLGGWEEVAPTVPQTVPSQKCPTLQLRQDQVPFQPFYKKPLPFPHLFNLKQILQTSSEKYCSVATTTLESSNTTRKVLDRCIRIAK